MLTKICRVCGEEKSLTQYRTRSESKDGLRRECIPCQNTRFAERYLNSCLKRFNLTREQYQLALQLQDHRCTICGRHESELTGRLVFDHNHATGEFRGLICDPCNRALGLLGDDVNRLVSAMHYLTERGSYGEVA